jgi:hypothetical protein
VTKPTWHPRKQLLFAALSAADFALTWWLIDHTNGHAYEANPVAGWWLAQAGWLGLAFFKAAVVALVLTIAVVVSRARPRAAGRLLWLGCACLVAVVGYSAALAAVPPPSPDDEVAQTNKLLEETNRQTRAQRRSKEALLATLDEITQDVLAQRCTLREGAERLEAATAAAGRSQSQDRTLGMLYPACTEAQRYACWLIARASGLPQNARLVERVGPRLEEEFVSGYGAPLPDSLRTWRGAAAVSGSARTHPQRRRGR